MNGTSLRKTVVVGHQPDGLHMRPATAFAKLARRFAGSVTVRLGELAADGTSPSELLMLMALPGTELLLEVDGPNAEEQLVLLAGLLAEQ